MRSPLSLTRRRILQGGLAAAVVGGALPRPSSAAPAERKFLFYFAGGGWDTTTVFDPHVSDVVDLDVGAVPRSSGALTWTDSPDRPGVTRFMRRWGRKVAIVNGVNAHSVGHDSGTQFMMTGTSASSYADWPTVIAANSRAEYPLPHVVFSGPSFPGTSGASVVRAGGGTLLDLIDGSIVGASDVPAPLPPTPADTMADALVYSRLARFNEGKSGLGARRADALMENFERSMELEGRRFEAGLDDLGSSLLDQSIKAVELMRLGLSRCAMIGIPGGWDSHGDNTVQGTQFEDFFSSLDELFEHLATTPGLATPWLIDEVTVVALSDFGRTPSLNGSGGKDHWPFGSIFVAGSGVNGGQSLGATDDDLIALDIDLSTGLASDGGEALGCEHVGTALLKLAGIDPEDVLPGIEPLSALIR